MTNTKNNLVQILTTQGITLENVQTTPQVMWAEITSAHWHLIATIAQQLHYRLAAIWAQQLSQHFKVTVVLATENQYLLLSTWLNEKKPELESYAHLYPAANRWERHIHDLYGIVFLNHPDSRRWTRHQAWSDQEFPLRRDYNTKSSATLTPPDATYAFINITGNVYEIPVGPVHAGIIEPGHFRFHADGENVIKLEERLGYVHKGIEKIAEQRTVNDLLRLAARVSGDSTVAHTLAACHACEEAVALEVPRRARSLRAIMLERERIANHLGDMGALCNDVGFAFGYYQFGRLRELWQRLNHQIFGHRFLMDQIIFGGVVTDLSEAAIESIHQQIRGFQRELKALYPIIEHNDSLQDRLVTTGILKPETAQLIGALGYVGKASHHNFDVRKNLPSFPYEELYIAVPNYTAGDVAARFKVRAAETLTSLHLINEFLKSLPPGKIALKSLPSLAQKEGFGYVEGWRGETLAYVRFDEKERVARYFPRDPSWLNWPALEHLIHGNIVPDFPLCNKSVNGSYSGHDL